MNSPSIKILDTTLREGEQTPGIYFPPHIKLGIARLLDQIGVDFIEAGHPAVSPNILGSIKQLSQQNFNARVAAHSRTMEQDVDLAIESGAKFLGVFYCVSNDRLNQVFKRTLAEAVDRIGSIIDYARAKNPELVIRYTPEDTVRSPYENVIAAASVAVAAGADIISIADTTGFMVPGKRSMYDFVGRLRSDLETKGLQPEIAVHCHNDRGLALANALDGIRAGASIVDVSVLGLGERAGIVDLAQLLSYLTVDLEQRPKARLSHLSELYQLVSEFTGVKIAPNFPIMGENAFTHCAGVHTNAATQNPLHYESLDPGLFSRERRFALDHMSGKSSVQFALDKLGVESTNGLLDLALTEVKRIGETGRMVSLQELKLIIDLHRN